MIPYKNYFEKREQIQKGTLSLKDNVLFFLNNIKKNEELNAFNFVFKEEALKSAEEIETKIKSGEGGRLAGLVVALKDIISQKEKRNTASSKILQNFEALYDAEIVRRMLDEDALIIGRTNCDEFAMGSSNENSAFGRVLNPVNRDYVPGGSSGGSAAAVAAGLCDAAIGTDTGGSIRQPAAFCGIYGLKPTYGRVSRRGLTSFVSSCDVIGPMSRNPEDAALLLEVIAGYDENDSTSVKSDVPEYSSLLENGGSLKIGIPEEYFGEGLDEEINTRINNIVSELNAGEFEIKKVSLPHTKYAVACYYIISTAESSSNLARYDGVRYGYRSEKGGTISDMYKNTRSEAFGDEVKRRIMLGTYVLSSGYYDAYYRKAQKVRRLIKDDFVNVFKDVDVLISPTTPAPPFRFGDKADPLQMYLSDVYTTAANLAGVPALNIPAGNTAEGLPIGMQLTAAQFREEDLLSFASYLKNNIL